MSESGSMHIDKHGNKHDRESVIPLLEQNLASFSAESLVQYKTISRCWYDLICSPEFVRLQRRCSRGDMIYVVCPYPDLWGGFRDVYLLDRDGDIIKTITLPCLNQPFSIRLISSFNGLLCFANEIEDNDIDIWICNPITQKVLMLPKGSPSIETPTVGVAFDAGSGHYKVFKFLKDILKSEDEYYNCEVYSSITRSWKGIGTVECRPIHDCYCQANPGHICIGGRLYWFSRSKRNPRTLIGILSVDMEKEKFKQISFPQNVKVYSLSCLIDLDGHLSLVTAKFMPEFISEGWFRRKTYIDIWVLEDIEQSKWCHKISTKHQLDEIITFNSVVAIKHEILFIVMDSDMVVHNHVYDLDKDDWRMLDVPSSSRWDCPVALPFAGSLCPCRGI